MAIWILKHITVLSGVGVGGGSLVYAAALACSYFAPLLMFSVAHNGRKFSSALMIERSVSPSFKNNDKSWIKINKLIQKYPLFVSYPRSGAHWINSMMELYFVGFPYRLMSEHSSM